MKIYYKKDNITLYHGDTLELLQSTKENSVDMIFADPPYNLSNDGFTVHAGKMVSVNKGKWDKMTINFITNGFSHVEEY